MRRRYPTDLTDAQWGCIEPYITFANRRGRPRIHSLRRVLDAVFYVLRSGCAWRLLPQDFPPWRVVYYYWGSGNGVLRVLSSILTRSCAGACENSRGETPNPQRREIVDSQTAKTTGVGGEQRGYDGGKKVRGILSVISLWTQRRPSSQSQGPQSAKVPDQQDGLKLLSAEGRPRAPSTPLSSVGGCWLPGQRQGVGTEQELGLSVEVVHRTPKPIP
jgi:transposase